MAMGFIIDKYYIRGSKCGNHFVRLKTNTKRLHKISNEMFRALIEKYI